MATTSVKDADANKGTKGSANDAGAEVKKTDHVDSSQQNPATLAGGAPTDDGERGEQALKARDEQVKSDKDKADKRDKNQATELKDAAKAKAQPAPDELRTLADTRDAANLANTGWTVQSDGSYYDGLAEPGQAFVPSQLPNREVQRAAGIDPDQQTAGLYVLGRDDATKNVVSGPEPWEARDLGLVK